MDNLLNYLKDKEFTSALLSFSTGATLATEWLFLRILENNQDSVKDFLSVFDLAAYGGSPCEKKDLEPTGKSVVEFAFSRFIKPLIQSSALNRHPFIKRAGGSTAIISRLDYLLSLDNVDKYKHANKEYFEEFSKILKTNPTFSFQF